MNKRHKRYCELRNMEQIRTERAKLHKMMRANAADLGDDWDEVRYWLTPANLADELMSRVYLSSGLVRNVVAGVRTVIGMIRGRKAGSC